MRQNAFASLIEEELERLLHFPESPFKRLYEAAGYSLFSGGKRLRPKLVLAACSAFGGDLSLAVRPACAIEMVHTYSMIHDDLPCMDDDDFRRGKPTLHKQYGEAHAVLTGDFLLTYAFQVLAEAPRLSPEQKSLLIALLARASGGEGMIGGQLLDILREEGALSEEALLLIHGKKTAALIAVSLQFGAALSGCGPDSMESMGRFGEALGLAFQIVDDILDAGSGEQATFVSLFGVSGAKKRAEELLAEALRLLRELPQETAPLEELAEELVKRSL